MLGIFSRIFSKNTENSSQVRKWVIQEMEQLDTENSDAYRIFVELIHTAIQCGKHSVEEENNKFFQIAKQYLGDATIFEIACYTYYQLENWLAKNEPGLKTKIALPVNKWIVEKFSLTFYLDEQRVNQLFKEQLDRYQAITGAGQGLAELHLELEQRILMSKGDKFDQKQLPPMIELDSQYIKLSLDSYEKEHLPAFMAGIQEYCSKHTSQQQAQIKKQPQNLMQNQEQDYIYGMALVAQEDWVRACNAFTKVLAANPNHYEALVQRGLLYITLHQPVDAVQDFTHAIEINPNEPAPYLYRGKCYHQYFRHKDKSLADYTAAISLAPQNATGYFGRGKLFDDIALSEEKKALEKNDHAKYAHISEEFLGAINDYSQVLALEPEHDGAYVSRGLAYARKARANGKNDYIVNAIADFEQAIKLNWENGYLYKQQDEMKELLEHNSPSEI